MPPKPAEDNETVEEVARAVADLILLCMDREQAAANEQAAATPANRARKSAAPSSPDRPKARRSSASSS